MNDDQPQPPPYLQENIVNLIDPRFVVLDYRRMMEPYHSLESTETGVRHQTRMALDAPLRLWLRAIALFRSAFTSGFIWPEGLSGDEKQARDLQEDLLGLAGGAAKPTLDALMNGYYWSAFGMIRSLLETCARVGFLRNWPGEALPYFQAPTESPVGPDGKPRKGRPRALSLKTIEEAYVDAPEEQKTFDRIHAGITHMHAGSHPSPEGMLQIYLAEDHKVFGPVFDRRWASFGLKWGGYANVVLLAELHALQPQGEGWARDYESLKQNFEIWLVAHNEEIADDNWVPTEHTSS